MKIIYCHHALRDMGNPPTQEDRLKPLGEEDANIVSKILEDGFGKLKFKAIYTSPFFRCKETARIINKHLDLPIIEEARFNEFGSVEGENWLDLQTRVREALKDIVDKYEEDDAVICVTSGVNVVSFISLVYKLKPSKKAPYIGVPSCSPLVFNITKDCF